jgi:hypothetical protein
VVNLESASDSGSEGGHALPEPPPAPNHTASDTWGRFWGLFAIGTITGVCTGVLGGATGERGMLSKTSDNMRACWLLRIVPVTVLPAGSRWVHETWVRPLLTPSRCIWATTGGAATRCTAPRTPQVSTGPP